MEDNIYKKLRESTETDNTPALTQGELSNIFEKENNPLSQSVISKLETSKKNPPSKSIDVLKAYSTHFKVTSDYLLGIRDTKAIDYNIANASETLGLSDDCIKTIISLDNSQKHLLNCLCNNKSDAFRFLLSTLYIYAMNCDCSHIILENRWIDIKQEMNTIESESILKASAIDSFSLVLNEVKKMYSMQREEMKNNAIELLETELKLTNMKKEINKTEKALKQKGSDN